MSCCHCCAEATWECFGKPLTSAALSLASGRKWRQRARHVSDTSPTCSHMCKHTSQHLQGTMLRFSAKTKKINAMLCVRFNIGNIRITNTDLVSQFNLIHSSLIWTCCFNMFLVSLRWAAWSTISFISCTGNCNCRGERKALARSLLHKRRLLANMDYCWSQCYSQQHTDLNTNTDWQKLTRVQKSLILHLQRQDESTAEIAAAK